VLDPSRPTRAASASAAPGPGHRHGHYIRCVHHHEEDLPSSLREGAPRWSALQTARSAATTLWPTPSHGALPSGHSQDLVLPNPD
jgi:hypothetical protein